MTNLQESKKVWDGAGIDSRPADLQSYSLMTALKCDSSNTSKTLSLLFCRVQLFVISLGPRMKFMVIVMLQGQ